MEKFLGSDSWHIRLSHNRSFDEIESVIQQISQKYIISMERPKIHFHCYVRTTKSEKDMRSILVDHQLHGRNKYSMTKVREEEQMKKYVVKEGDIRYKGFSDKEMEIFIKKSKSKDKHYFVELEDQYMEGKLTYKEFAIAHVKHKTRMGQRLNPNQIKQYLTSVFLRKNPDEIEYWMESNFMFDI